jgi:hypothetical protein
MTTVVTLFMKRLTTEEMEGSIRLIGRSEQAKRPKPFTYDDDDDDDERRLHNKIYSTTQFIAKLHVAEFPFRTLQ